MTDEPIDSFTRYKLVREELREKSRQLYLVGREQSEAVDVAGQGDAEGGTRGSLTPSASPLVLAIADADARGDLAAGMSLRAQLLHASSEPPDAA